MSFRSTCSLRFSTPIQHIPPSYIPPSSNSSLPSPSSSTLCACLTAVVLFLSSVVRHILHIPSPSCSSGVRSHLLCWFRHHSIITKRRGEWAFVSAILLAVVQLMRLHAFVSLVRVYPFRLAAQHYFPRHGISPADDWFEEMARSVNPTLLWRRVGVCPRLLLWQFRRPYTAFVLSHHHNPCAASASGWGTVFLALSLRSGDDAGKGY